MTTKSKQDITDNIKRDLETAASNYSASLDANASALKTDFANATESKANQVIGQVNGGIESVSQQITDVSGKLNTGAIEGVITDKVTALENAVNTSAEDILNLRGGTGTKVSLSWSQPDSDGNVYPLTKSLVLSVDESINAMLAKMTGLNVFSGYVQKIAGQVTPKGMKSQLEKLKGKVGAFDGVEQLNQLTAQANQIASDVQTEVNNAVQGALSGTLPPNANLDVDGAPKVTVPNPGENFQGVATAAQNLVNGVTNSVNEVSNRIQEGIKIDQTKLKDDFAGLTGKSGEDVFASVTKGVDEGIQKLKDGKANYDQAVDVFVSDSKTGVLQGAAKKQIQEADDAVRGLAPNLTSRDRDQIIADFQGSKEARDRAINAVASSSGKTYEEVRSGLQDLDTTIAGSVIVANEESAFADPFDLSPSEDYTNSDAKFTYISSVEELEAEMDAVDREVTEVVVHWTDTYTNKNIGSEEIHKIQQQLGLSAIGYHYVIRRDGSLQRGRPVNEQGEHASANGHDQYSIGICFVGGINVPSGTAFPDNYRGAGSLTLAQMNTFREFCQAFYNQFPGGQILGHNDIDALEEDPGFDVRDYVEDVFNKRSLFEDPSARGPFSPSELITAEIPQ